MNEPHDLDPLFKPETVAFIGASENSGRFLSIYDNFVEYGREQNSFFVNPNRDSVFGDNCYDSILDVPAEIDLAIIIVPAQVVPGVFEECGEANVRTAMVVSAEFGESGEEGKKRQQRLAKLSEKYNLPFCGPNTYGVLSAHDDTAIAQVSSLNFDVANVSAVLQSGGLLNQVLYSGAERGFGFSKIVDSGNEASITSSQYIDYMLEDENTDVVIGIIEAFRNEEEFLSVAEKAAELSKPLVILKIARSEKGGEMAQSHTGAITESDDIVTAALKQHGVVQAPSLDLLIETAEIFSKVSTIPGNGVGVIEISGGGCTLFTDAVAETELQLPELSPSTIDVIEGHLPAIGVARNPVDMAMGWGAEAMTDAHSGVLQALDQEDDIDVIASRLSIPQEGSIGAAGDRLEDIKEANEQSDKTFVVISRASGKVSNQWTERIKDTDIPFLQEYHKSIRALELASQYAAFQEVFPERKGFSSSLEQIEFDTNRSIIPEHEAKDALSELDLTMPEEQLATSREEAVQIADEIGYPVCLKIISADVPHKSDVGGIATGITSRDEVKENYDRVLDSLSEARPDAVIDGVLVQEMVEDGVEVLVGAKQTQFGQAVIVGLGGVFTELLDETSIRIAPFQPAVAKEMLQELRGSDVLTGARGGDAVDVGAFADTIASFSEFVAANQSITEADLNPVIVTDRGAYIVDALFHIDS